MAPLMAPLLPGCVFFFPKKLDHLVSYSLTLFFSNNLLIKSWAQEGEIDCSPITGLTSSDHIFMAPLRVA